MDSRNDNRLKDAAELGDINLLYTVIKENPHVLEQIDVIPFVETPLHVAAASSNLQFATEIMRLKPSFAYKLNQEGFSPIHLAIEHGHERMVYRFIDINRELVRVKGREGVTPLHLASEKGKIELLANLLLACPDSIEDVTVRSENALHVAVKYQQHQALQLLVGWLHTTRQTRAMQLEPTILNWKDEAGNTILHLSTLLNDSRGVELLVKTKIDLKAKNLEKSTALDIASSGEIKRILVRAGAKRGSLIQDPPILADKLRSNITLLDKMMIFILRIRRDISEDQRNAFLVVAALIATATYQSALNPPGGVYQASANAGSNGQIYINALDSNSTSKATNIDIQGTSVMGSGDFLSLSIFSALSIIVPTIVIYILTPSGIVGNILFSPIFWFAFCFLYSMKVISPTSASSNFNLTALSIFCFLYTVVSWAFSLRYKKLERYAHKGEMKKRTSAGGRNNRW